MKPIVEVINISIPSEKESELRGVVSEWSNKIPHHPYQNLGHHIKMKGIVFCPAYKINVFAQYYSHSFLKGERPYKGESLNNYTDDEAAQISLGRYTSQEIQLVVNGSERVDKCYTCKGHGETICEDCDGEKIKQCTTCRGLKTVNCSYCQGSGEENCNYCTGRGYQDCSYCSGNGYKSCNVCCGAGYINKTESVYDYNLGQYVTVHISGKCPNCNYGKLECTNWGCNDGKVKCSNYSCRRGKVTCSNYSCRSGKVTCSDCGGNGYKTCRTCSGEGTVTCKTCKGYKRLVFYDVKLRKWDYGVWQGFVFHPNHHVQKFPKFRLIDKLAETKLYDKNFVALNGNEFEKEPAYFQKIYVKTLLNCSHKGLKVDSNNTLTSLFQGVTINMVKIYIIDYHFNTTDYALAIAGNNQSIYEELGPIIQLKENLKTTGKFAFYNKKFGDSYENLLKAQEMDPDSYDNELKAIFAKARLKIRSSYWVGAFVGTFVWAYIFTLLFADAFFENRLLRKFIRFESNTDWLNRTVSFYVLVIVLSFSFWALIRERVFNFFKVVKPERKRMFIGFLISFFLVWASVMIELILDRYKIFHFMGNFIPSKL